MEPAALEAEPQRRRFHFRRCLGRGGFGEVYLATQQSAGGVESSVAVKLLHADLDPESQAVQRLRDEGRLLGHLDHPCILRVSDLVHLEGRLALVTEYVDGCDLDDCWKAGSSIPDRPLVEIVGMVADALAAAWAARTPDGRPLELVHRDVKPSNIRVGRHGTVKLLDFGIARAHDGHREARTGTSQVMGSFLFMAPERLDLESEAPPGPPADVFALGATLFQGLAREPLFAGLSEKRQYLLSLDREAFDRTVGERLAVLAGRDPALIELVRSMVTHDPGPRPTAAEVARRCEALAETLEGPPLRRWCRDATWPTAESVKGALDGAVVTESSARGRLPASRRADGADDTSPTVQPVRVERSLLSRVLVGVAGLGVVGVGGIAVATAALLAVVVLIVAARPGEPAPPERIEVAPAPPPVVAPAPPPPEPVAAPAPVTAPAPAPVVAPAPRPAAVPRPAAATWTVEGSTAVELRAGSRVARPGRLEPGGWEIWADFGKGFVRAGELTVAPGASIVLRCNRIRMTCTEGG